MKISAFMTVKHGERWVESCLETLSQQTMPLDEVVIVDDGSVDGTLSAIKTAVSKLNLNGLKVVATGGIGRAKALNIAWRACSGDFLANIDVDDGWLAEKTSIQYNVINASLADFVTTNSAIITKEEAIVSAQEVSERFSIWSSRDFLVRNPINHSSLFIRKSTLEDIGGYNENLRRHIDYDLWIRLLARGKLGVNVSSKLAVKRVHDQQSFEASARYKYVWSSFLMRQRAISTFGAPAYFRVGAAIAAIYSLLPQSIRRHLK